MTEHCPLTDGASPGFHFGSDIPQFCVDNCETLWDESIKATEGSYENYRDVGLDESICPHLNVEHSHESLQATKVGSPNRIYTLVDMCMDCSLEVDETSFAFNCPRV